MLSLLRASYVNNNNQHRHYLEHGQHASYWRRRCRAIPSLAASAASHLRCSPRCSSSRRTLSWPSTAANERHNYINYIQALVSVGNHRVIYNVNAGLLFFFFFARATSFLAFAGMPACRRKCALSTYLQLHVAFAKMIRSRFELQAEGGGL